MALNNAWSGYSSYIEMEAEKVGRGVITMASTGYCEMAAYIKGSRKTLPFNRKMFYSFGDRCEGDMTSVLREGMEVHFCYACPQPQVIGVWVRGKPYLKIRNELKREEEGRGTITKMSAMNCVLSATINGTQEELSFDPRAFYPCGIRGEGDMTNVLKRGTEVDFCYTASEFKPVVIVVWLGDRPDLSVKDDVMGAASNPMNRAGRGLGSIHTLAQSNIVHNDFSANGKVVNPDGSQDQEGLAMGGDMGSGAAPSKFGGDSGAMYEAIPSTSSCTGKVQNKDINTLDASKKGSYSKKNFEFSEESPVYGTVTSIINELVASLDVAFGGFCEKVMLFRKSFEQECGRLQDIIKVGDRVLVVLSFGLVSCGCKRWYAAKAWTDSALQVALPKEPETNDIVISEQRPPEPSTSRGGPTEPIARPSGNVPPRFNERSKVLYNDPPLSGVIYFVDSEEDKPGNAIIVCEAYGSLSIYMSSTLFFIDEVPCNDQLPSLVQSGRTVVYFEAVMTNNPSRFQNINAKYTHDATIVWIGRKPRLDSFIYSLPRVADASLVDEDVTLFGSVVRLYLPDKAVVCTNQLSVIVCLHVEAFFPIDQPSSGNALITDFVHLKQRLSYRLVRDPECAIKVRAVDVKRLSASELRSEMSTAMCRTPHVYELYRNGSEQNVKIGGQDVQPEPQTEGGNGDKLIYREPPLRGAAHWISTRHAIICYEGIRIFLSSFNLYDDNGDTCYNFDIDKRRSAPRFRRRLYKYVYFDAISAKTSGPCSHYATLAWVNNKPSLYKVAEAIQGFPEVALPYSDRVFVGTVIRFYLPNDALIQIKVADRPTVVCLHMEAFGGQSKPWENGNPLISQYVGFKEFLQFKVRRDRPACPAQLCAYDVVKSSEDAYNSFCATSSFWTH